MAGLIDLLSWTITNWQLLATVFSSVSSLALFFMHGNAKTELQQLRDFIDSLDVSQKPPVSPDLRNH